MEGEKEQTSPAQRRGDWLKHIVAEYDKIENYNSAWKLPEGEYPPWLENVEREFAKAMFPVAKLKSSNVLSPGLMGAMLGHQCSYAVWERERLTEEDLKDEALRHSFDKWYAALRRLAKKALCSSVDQSYEDMTEFLLAYSTAFSKKPKGNMAADIGGTTFEIYAYLLMYWRVIERYKSVSELHAALRKALGEHRTGDLKRIEKLCQRVGLHFGKPGRPKKSE